MRSRRDWCVQQLEAREVPNATLDTLGSVFAVGTDAGPVATATLYNADGTVRFEFQPFGSAFTGGVRVAVGDVDGDRTPDLITAAGPGGEPAVTVFSGVDGEKLGTFYAFEKAFTGGVNVASADLDRDGTSEIIVSPDSGGGARVRVLQGADGSGVVADFFGIQDTNFRGGARVGAGDLNGDGTSDLIVGAGTGGGPRVAIFDGSSVVTSPAGPSRLVNDFFALDSGLRDGVNVASGDLNGDGHADIVFGGGAGAGPRVTALDGLSFLSSGGQDLVVLLNTFAFDSDLRSGVRLAVGDVNGDGTDDVLASPGPGGGDSVQAYIGADQSQPTTLKYPSGSLSGSFVAAAYGPLPASGPLPESDLRRPKRNSPPKISDVADRTIQIGTSSGLIAFTVDDKETPRSQLTVTAVSSNPALVPASGIALGGSGGDRTVTVTPAAAQAGVATVTLTVTDAGGLTASDTFTVTVPPPPTVPPNVPPPPVTNTPPKISDVANRTIQPGTSSGLIAFTVSDAETAAAGLTVTAVSSNPALVPASGIALGGSGGDRTVTVTPAAAQAGVATVTLTVTDAGGLTASDTFTVTVPPTVPPAAGISRTIKPGVWSDPSVWDVVPAKDRDVVITHDLVIDSGEARRVDVEVGITTLAGTLHAYGSVVVHSTLQGTQGALLFHVANDRLFMGNTAPGPDPANPDDHSDTDVGLWIMEGSTVKLTGPQVTSWLNAVPVSAAGTAIGYGGVELPTIGNGTAKLSAPPVGWLPGDTLLLTSVQGKYTLATLTSVVGDTVTYQEQKADPAAADFSAPTVVVEGRSASPKVANLSRRLLIASADVKEGDTNHRAHTIVMHHAHVHLNNVEFRNLGPTAKLGRYPVHFHHSGHAEHESGVVGSSIWQSVSEAGNRFVAIHASQGVAVKDNVALRSEGHGYFMEIGTEVMNTVTGNLSVDVRGPDVLKVTNGDVAPGSHHYWLYTGNTVERNVAVGGTDVGMVLLPESNPEMTNASAVASDNEFYGVGKYAIWSRGTASHYVRVLAAYSGQSGVGDSGWPDYSGITLDDPTLLYNGLPGNVYATQIFMNSGRQTRINGGLLVGTSILHTHYTTSFVLEGTTVRGQSLIEPTYWEVGGLVRNVNMQVDTLFIRPYPLRRTAPGLVRIEGAVGRVGTSAYTASSPLTADYVPTWAPNVPGFTGTDIGNGVRRLDALAMPSGFIRTPDLPRFSTWSVVTAGSSPGATIYLAESENGWRNNIAGLGYFEGFPAGVYDVTIKTPDGRTLAYKGVTVVAGQMTDLSTYTPVITYSAELGWSWSSPLTVAPTSSGGFTVERTYQIDGLAAGSDFTISYYYSTSQWGNNPTLLGSETVTAAEGKTVGVHSGVSPEFKITTSGTYYVFARIDTGNQLAENNEDDNMSVTVKLTI